MASTDDGRERAAARRAATVARRLQGRALGAIADAAQGAFVYVDRHERIRYFSAGAEVLYGLPRAEMVGRTVREVTRPEAYERYSAYIGRALAGDLVEYDRRLRRADGSERFVRARLVPHRSWEGEVRGYLGHFVDVTDLVEANAAAELSQARFADFARASGDWFWESDTDGRLVWLSESVERITGVTRTWFLGKTPADLVDPVVDADREAWRQRALARERREPYRGFRYCLRLPRGSLWIANSGVPRFDASGAFGGYRGTTTDISEQVRLEEATRTALRDLESFSYSVSHDLRAPARAINGFASIIIEDHAAALPAEAHRLLHRIVDAGRDMGALVDALLALGRVSRQELLRVEVDLCALARQVWDECEERTPSPGARFATASPIVANGDPVLLRMLLRNLIENARKYAKPGVPPAVELLSVDGHLCVADQGIGFDMMHAGRLFTPFQRLHADPRYDGNGIGLAIVRKIVERHGGRVWATAEPGRGAEIRFTLVPAGISP